MQRDILKTAKRPRIQRKHYICENGNGTAKAIEDLRQFWAEVPGERTEMDGVPLELADPESMGLRFWRVDHSIPGSGAFGIKTPIGWVIYSGDLRTHGHSSWRTAKFAREAAALKPALLIVEGTRVASEKSIREKEVYEAADEVVAAESGLVIADFSARNIERLRTFRDIAKARGRQLVMTTKDAYLLGQLHVIDPAIPDPSDDGLAVLKVPKATVENWEKEMLNRFAGNLVDARQVRRERGAYILCLSYWDIGNLVDMGSDGGTYIFSASEAYDDEHKIDHLRLENWLDHFGFKEVGGLPNAKKGPYHASGHIDGPALETLIEQIGAERILPVHTTELGWFEQRWGERVVKTEYGVTNIVG